MMVWTEQLAAGLYDGFDTWRRWRRQKRYPWLVNTGAPPGTLRFTQMLALLRRVPSLFVSPAYTSSTTRHTVAEITDELAREAAEAHLNRHITICVISGALATVGAIGVPGVGWLSVPGILYVTMPTLRQAYTELRHERRVSMAMVYSMLVMGTLGLRQHIAMSLAAGLRLFGQQLLRRTEDHSTQSLLHLMGTQPQHVRVLQAGHELEIPFEALRVGDQVLVYTGETVPVDGVVVSGLASIDQHVLTGEAQPVEKGQGDQVFASTLVVSGHLSIAVERAGQDTVAAQIGEVLSRTADFRSLTELRAQRFGDQSALPVLALSAVTLPVLGPVSAVSILYASFGYDLRITAPMSALNFLRLASERGILVKDGRALERLQEVDYVIFDKTGTLTLDQPRVGQLYPYGDCTEEALLAYAAAAEYRQTHPIARAILHAATQRQVRVPHSDEAAYDIGYGITAHVCGQTIRVGSARFITLAGVTVPEEVLAHQQHGQAQGYSFVYVALGEQVLGCIELHAARRPEVPATLAALRRHGVGLCILSGDQEAPTSKLAAELGIRHYVANALPEHKADLVAQLQRSGKTVCFVGDGINDAIALKQADVSISLRGAATLATDTAQIVLLDQTLDRLGEVFALAQQLRANMRHNILITIASSAATVGAVYCLQFGVIGSLVLYNIGLAAGMVNASLPLLTAQAMDEGTERTEREDDAD